MKKIFKIMYNAITNLDKITAKHYPIINKIPKRNKWGLHTSYKLYEAVSGNWCILDDNSKSWFAVNLETKDIGIAKKILKKSGVTWKEASWNHLTSKEKKNEITNFRYYMSDMQTQTNY